MRRTRFSLGGEFHLIEFTAERVGDLREFNYPVDVPRNSLNAASIYIDGEFAVVSEAGEEMTRRLPGTFSCELPDIPAGKYTMVALHAGARSVCVMPSDKSKRLIAAPVRASAGETITIPQGSAFVICKGELLVGGTARAPYSYCRATSPMEVTASSDVLGLKMEGL